MLYKRFPLAFSRIVFVLLLLAMPALFTGCGLPAPASNTNATNTATQTNASTNVSTNTTINSATTLKGRVFLKGYKTPSESYGILTDEGLEIGMGKYDAMREQLRPYVGAMISVKFSRICKATEEGCCRSIFTTCGIVASWEPVKE